MRVFLLIGSARDGGTQRISLSLSKIFILTISYHLRYPFVCSFTLNLKCLLILHSQVLNIAVLNRIIPEDDFVDKCEINWFLY